MLSHVNDRLTPKMKLSLNAPINIEELNEMAKGKALGLDGMVTEFYKLY